MIVKTESDGIGYYGCIYVIPESEEECKFVREYGGEVGMMFEGATSGEVIILVGYDRDLYASAEWLATMGGCEYEGN